MPGELKPKMEKHLGADLSGVKIHTGGASAQAAEGLGARAFTVGQDVHFGAGEFAPGTKEGDRLIAHELTHTVQAQKSGVQRKPAAHDDGAHDAHDAGAGEREVSQPHEPAEKEADAIADHVTEKMHGGKEGDLAAPAESAPPVAAKLSSDGPRVFLAPKNGPQSDASLQSKAGGGLKPATTQSGDPALVNLGNKSMAKNPNFEADAIAFEQKLGAKAFSHSAAVGAAADMASKAKKYLQTKAGGEWDAASTQLAADLQKVAGDNPGWSGSVGKAIHDIMAVFDSGNVAERMNHVSNFFTEVMSNDLATQSVAKLKTLLQKSEMDARLLLDRRREMLEKAAARGGAVNKWDIAPVPDKLPDGKRNPVTNQRHTRANRADAMGIAPDDKAARTEVNRGGRKLADTGAQMSGREVALHQKGDPNWDPQKDAVKWEEGTRIWVMNERDRWVQVMRRLSLPIGAGPSGSTSTLMNAAKAFGTEVYGARAACIAYLLPPRHHTLVEILSGAAAFGCAFQAGQKMYRDIKPFSEEELRGCGKNGKFPDETADAADGSRAAAGGRHA